MNIHFGLSISITMFYAERVTRVLVPSSSTTGRNQFFSPRSCLPKDDWTIISTSCERIVYSSPLFSYSCGRIEDSNNKSNLTFSSNQPSQTCANF